MNSSLKLFLSGKGLKSIKRDLPNECKQGRLNKERGRSRCHKRPKSREETPKEGIGDNDVAAPQ